MILRGWRNSSPIFFFLPWIYVYYTWKISVFENGIKYKQVLNLMKASGNLKIICKKLLTITKIYVMIRP